MVIQMNKSLPLAFGTSNGEVSTVDEGQIKACKSFKDALRLCMRLSRVKRTQADLAFQAGINVCQFSKILHSDFHLPGDSIAAIEKLCGNTAMTQWLALQHGATLHIKTDAEKLDDCQAELAAFKAKVAA
jgi:plasmid maintenance system antidote protein VapI